MGSLATDIIQGTCVSWGAYSSYAEQRAMGTTLVFFTYILPLMVTVLCYTRIIYALLARPVSTVYRWSSLASIKLGLSNGTLYGPSLLL